MVYREILWYQVPLGEGGQDAVAFSAAEDILGQQSVSVCQSGCLQFADISLSTYFHIQWGIGTESP